MAVRIDQKKGWCKRRNCTQQIGDKGFAVFLKHIDAEVLRIRTQGLQMPFKLLYLVLVFLSEEYVQIVIRSRR